MRRVVVELPREDFVRLKGDSPFYAALDSLEVLHILSSGPEGATSVVKIRPKDPRVPFEELARLARYPLELLEARDGAFTCVMKFGKSPLMGLLGAERRRGYLVPPIELGERARMTFVGSRSDVSAFLDKLRSRGLHYRTLSISDLRLSPASPLNALTDKQRRVLTAAYRQGYYDRPRRVSTEGLARSLGLSSSTVVNHRLKAERRVLSAILARETP